MPTDSSPKFTPTHRSLRGYPHVAWDAGIEVQLVQDETVRDNTMLFARADGDQRWLASYDVEPLPQPGWPITPDAKPMPVVSVRVDYRAQLSGDGDLTADVLIYALGQLPVAGDQRLHVESTQYGKAWRVDVTWVTTEETGR